jgi:hypothetical protein
MTLRIELTSEEDARLRAAASEQGIEPEVCAHRLLTEHLPPLTADRSSEAEKDPTIALFEQWEAEDATDDPEEIARRIQEWEELKAGLNANRRATGERLLFP